MDQRVRLESEPDVLSNDPVMAGLMVRIGMAANALTVHLHLATLASQQKADAVRQRDNAVALVMAASLTFEGIVLANKYQRQLRPLLQRAGGNDDLLSRVGKLLGGKHPASGFLDRARNSFGFHWDYEDEFIGPILYEFMKNEKIAGVLSNPRESSQVVETLWRRGHPAVATQDEPPLRLSLVA